MTGRTTPPRPRRSIAAVLLAATAACAAPEAYAISEARFDVFWGVGAGLGNFGAGSVIGMVTLGYPNPFHEAFEEGKVRLIPNPLIPSIAGGTKPHFDPDALTETADLAANSILVRPFATAMATTIVASDLSDFPGQATINPDKDRFGNIGGFAPLSTLLACGVAEDISSVTGLPTPTSTSPFNEENGSVQDSVLCAMLLLTDQVFADAAAARMRIAPWQVASVVHMSVPFRQPDDSNTSDVEPVLSRPQLAGEDAISRIVNIITTMTPATVVVGAGDEAANPSLSPEDGDQSFGTVAAPGTATNALTVGRILADNFEDSKDAVRANESGIGPMPLRRWRGLNNGSATGTFFNTSRVQAIRRGRNCDSLESPGPQSADLPDAPTTQAELVTSVDLIAPGSDLRLASGPFAADPLSNTEFSDLWGSIEFSSAIVAGAIGVMHSASQTFNGVIPHNTVTRAVMINSALKPSSWSNPLEATSAGVLSTSSPLPKGVGAGVVDLESAILHIAAASPAGGYADITQANGAGRSMFGLAARASAAPVPTQPPPSESASLISSPSDVWPAYLPLIDDLSDIQPGEIESLYTDPTRAMRTGADFVRVYRCPEDDEGGSGSRSAVSRWRTPLSNAMPLTLPAVPDAPPNDRFFSTGGAAGSNSFLGNGTRDTGFQSSGGFRVDNTKKNRTDNRRIEARYVFPRSPGRYRLTGWDHGMLGTGHIDFPPMILSTGSGITATLCWNRHERLSDDPGTGFMESFLNAIPSGPPPVVFDRSTPRVPDMLLRPALRRTAMGTLLPGEAITPCVGFGFRNTGTPPPPLPAGHSYADASANVIDPVALGSTYEDNFYKNVCAIRIGSDQVATGVALTNFHILTTAHQFTDGIGDNSVSLDQVEVRFQDSTGKYVNIATGSPRMQLTAIKPHPSWSGDVTEFNDLAILTLIQDGGAPLGLSDPAMLNGLAFPQINQALTSFSNGVEAHHLEFVGHGLGSYANTGWGLLTTETDENKKPVCTPLVPVSPPAIISADSNVKRKGQNLFSATSRLGITSTGVNYLAGFIDFDSPTDQVLGPGGDSFRSLGNHIEAIPTQGDSGAPLFLLGRYNQTTASIGDPPNNDILGPSATPLLYGIVSYVQGIQDPASHSGWNCGQFGDRAVFINLSTPSNRDFIDNTTNPPPVLTTGLFAHINKDLEIPGVDEFKYDDLNLKLFRARTDGGADVLVAESVSEYNNVEHIHIEPRPADGSDSGGLTHFGVYYLRAEWAGTEWDFGGFFGINAVPSLVPIRTRNNGNSPGDNGFPYGVSTRYVNMYPAEVLYGLAWHTTFANTDRVFLGNGSSSARSVLRGEDFLGDMNTDSRIDAIDLGQILGRWGSAPDNGVGDLNADGAVDAIDLMIVLGNWRK